MKKTTLILCLEFTKTNSKVGLITKNEYIFSHIYMPLFLSIILIFAGFVSRKIIEFDLSFRKVDSIYRVIASDITAIVAIILMIALHSNGLFLIGSLVICINLVLIAYDALSLKNKHIDE